MRKMRWLAGAAALMAALTQAGLPDPKVKVELTKAEDSAGITSAGEAAVVTITSRSGIGGARLVRLGESWPERLTIRLRLKGLESFQIGNGRIRCETFLKNNGPAPYWKIAPDEQRAGEPDGTLAIAMTAMEDAIEVALPAELTKDNPVELSIAWIDFFRH